MYLLTHATPLPYKTYFAGKEVTLKPGQLITSRNSISNCVNKVVNSSKVHRVLKAFENAQQIEQQTSNKNRLITLINWEKYQASEQRTEQQMNIKRTTSEHQANTNREYKEDKEDKEDKENNNLSSSTAVDRQPPFDYQSVIDCFNTICVSLPKVQRLTDKRRKAIKSAAVLLDDMSFEALFTTVEQSDFLTGRSGTWSCGFDWIVKPSNLTKIIEGNYQNSKQGGIAQFLTNTPND